MSDPSLTDTYANDFQSLSTTMMNEFDRQSNVIDSITQLIGDGVAIEAGLQQEIEALADKLSASEHNTHEERAANIQKMKSLLDAQHKVGRQLDILEKTARNLTYDDDENESTGTEVIPHSSSRGKKHVSNIRDKLRSARKAKEELVKKIE
jgi:hypothetical protein